MRITPPNLALAGVLSLTLALAAAKGVPAQDDAGGAVPAAQVFFAPGSADLDPRAFEELRRWAAGAAADSGERLLVSGYADSVGSVAANRALSERRARAVAGALVDLGVDPGRIDVEGLGESDAAVQTADGVSEPMNRRAAVGFASPGGCMSGGERTVCAPQRGIPFCPGDRRCKRPRG